jgi:chorismate dehydratase
LRLKGPLPPSLRLGCVQYLNSRPLIEGWPGDVQFDHPSALSARLAAGELDVAFVSSFEFLRNPVYSIVDGVSISSRGPVFSVYLAHAGRLQDVEEIELDPASQTSVNLLHCLLVERGLPVPRFVASTPAKITAGRGKLFIGDQAIRFRRSAGEGVAFWDLGEEWRRLTGRPFVFALWLARPEFASAKQVADALRAVAAHNLAHLDDLIAKQSSANADFCRFYYRECLHFGFGAAEKEGLLAFHRLCVKHELLPAQNVELRCF